MTICRPLTTRTRLGEADVPPSATQNGSTGIVFLGEIDRIAAAKE